MHARHSDRPRRASFLSDPDPMRRAQIQMRTPLPKRFYAEVAVAPKRGGFAVHLDGKPVKTPGRAVLPLPTERRPRWWPTSSPRRAKRSIR